MGLMKGRGSILDKLIEIEDREIIDIFLEILEECFFVGFFSKMNNFKLV